ncbi:hypothetical protein Fmac_024340 [Flemingia macrophylla]|uniref:Uncharacterized protein n=1 Tax=Flemingia macrophylla TaxID=520843 RepID=A0ABD1LP49_9FABA
MELEETEDEECYTSSKYSSQPNNVKSSGKVKWVLKRELCLGRKILVAGFVAFAAPVVVPSLVVASAIGLAVSLPCAIFLASHACTQNLMSKLLPIPTPQDPSLREETCYKDERQQALEGETKRDIEMDGVQCMNNGENMGLVSECGPREAYAKDEMEGHTREETNGVQVQLMSRANGVVTMIEGVDEIENGIEEFETPFEVTTVVLDESRDQDMEGDIEEAELQNETNGLLEKIRDEGRTQEREEYVKGMCEMANENDQTIGPVVEDMEVAWEDAHSGIIVGTEEDWRKEGPNACEEMFQSRNDESEDTICNEVESGEYARDLIEGKEFNNTNVLQNPMAEPSELLHGRCFTHETIQDEPVEDLRIEALVYNIPVEEDSSEVIIEKPDMLIAEEEPEAPLDCPTQLQEAKLDDNISVFENQESQLHELNEMVYSSDAEARETANESALDLFDGKQKDHEKYALPIDLHEESSHVDGHTDSMEVLVSSVEQESGPSECSSGENIICPSQEVVVHEDNIRKQINVIRKIVGYEGTKQATCAEELKALYIFTGVKPPTSLNENSSALDEIQEKLHFLMSILGIKWNMA